MSSKKLQVIFWTYRNFLKQGKIAKALANMLVGAEEALQGGSYDAFAQRANLEPQRLLCICLGVSMACLSILGSNQVVFGDTPAVRKSTAIIKDGDDNASAKQSSVKFDVQSLCRLDFMIKGKTCAVCLLGIQNRLQKTPGVVKAAVMLKAPYGASILYDGKQISEKSIAQIVTNNDKYTSLLNLKLTHLTKVPIVFIPPVN